MFVAGEMTRSWNRIRYLDSFDGDSLAVGPNRADSGPGVAWRVGRPLVVGKDALATLVANESRESVSIGNVNRFGRFTLLMDMKGDANDSRIVQIVAGQQMQ